MPAGSRICPHCQGLNSAGEERCFRCGQRLPGPWLSAASEIWVDALGRDFPLTKVFWGFIVIVFVACIAVEGGHVPLRFSGGFRDSTLLRFGMLEGRMLDDEPWRLLSAVFIHLNVWHVIFNAGALVSLGRSVEADLGSARFAVIFVVSGIVGFAVSSWWYPGFVPTGGASGAIFGLMGVELGELWARRRPDFRGALVRVLILAVLLELAFSVNTPAHLGGLLAGGVLGFLFQKERRTFGLGRAVVLLAVLAVLGSVASVALATRSIEWKTARQRELRYE
jgi:rhomboid protease GluP